MVQMHVDGRENDFVMIVLDVRERGLEMRLVMVIDQRDGAGDFAGVDFWRCSTIWSRIMSAMASERLS
jgi:hypothetical protein